MRMNDNLLESWRVWQRVNTSNIAIDPGNDRAEGIVVVRVHGGIAGVSVPPLPPGGRSFREHVAPGWIGIVQQQAISNIGAPVVSQGEEQEGRAQKTGGQV